MRIVHIVSDYPPSMRGGSAVVAQRLAVAQAAAGHEVFVVTGCATGHCQSFRVDSGVRVYRVLQQECVDSTGNLDFDPLAYHIMRIVHDLPVPDILHAHHWVANSSLIHRRLPWTAIVATDHGNHRGHSSVHQTGSFAQFAWIREQELFDRADMIVHVSQSLSDDARDSISHPSTPHRVIPNPLSPALRLAERTVGTVPRLAFVGRPEPEKGFPLAVRAMRSVQTNLPSELAFYIPYAEADIRKSSAPAGHGELGLTSEVDCVRVGLLPEAVATAMLATDVLCFPSRHEGFGLAALEAAAARCHVVARPLPALLELAQRFPDAFTFLESEDEADWAEALERAAMAGPPCEMAIDNSLSPYDAHGVAESYLDCYSEARLSRAVPRMACDRSTRTIVVVSPEDQIRKTGGIGTWADLFRGALQADSDANIVFLRCAGDVAEPTEFWLSERSLHIDWPVLADPCRISTLSLKAQRLLRATQVVHLQFHVLAPIAHYLAALFECPLVYTSHSLVAREVSAWNGRSHPAALDQARIIRHADRVVAPSVGEARLISEQFPDVGKHKIVAIPNGYDLTPRPEKRTGASAPLRFVYSGRFVEQKGLHLVLRAFAAARESGLEEGTLLCMGLGHGARAYEMQLLELRRRLDLDRSVEFQPWSDDREHILTQMRHADVFLSAARYEPFGYTYMDALEAGLACLVTRTSGSEQIFGADFPFWNSDRLAADLVDVASHWPALAEATIDARHHAGTLSTRRMVQQYENLFASLVVPPHVDALLYFRKAGV